MIEARKAVMRKPLLSAFFMIATIIALMSAANSLSLAQVSDIDLAIARLI